MVPAQRRNKRKKVRQASRIKISFGSNLFRDDSNSRQRWYARYTFQRRRYEITIGYLPEMSLPAAYKKANEIARIAKQGEDPKFFLEAAERKQNQTVGEVWGEVFEGLQKVHRWVTDKQYRSLFRMYVLPVLYDIPVRQVVPKHVRLILGDIWETKPPTAKKVLLILRAFFGYAISHDLYFGSNPAAWKDNLDGYLPPIEKVYCTKHFRAASLDLVRRIMPVLSASEEIGDIAAAFGTLTGLRVQEFAGLRWDEIDRERMCVTIPWIRIKTAKKTRKNLVVPLVTQTMHLLFVKAVFYAQKHHIRSEYVFPGLSKETISVNTPRLALIRVSGQPITMHGMRSTFRDWAEEAGISYLCAESFLNHSSLSKTVSAYLRTQLFQQRRRAAQQWADAICPRPEGCSVVVRPPFVQQPLPPPIPV